MRYKIKEGHESRVFINTRRVDGNIIESDVELNSPFLEAIDGTSAQPAPVVGTASQQNPAQPVQADANPNGDNK